MLQREHSAILLTLIKLPFVIKIFVLSIFEWPFYTGFTVHSFTMFWFLLQRVTEEMENFLQELKSKVKVALVGGSDLVKIAEQMGGDDGKSEFRPPDKRAYLKLFFLLLNQNICCGYSKEPSQ